MHEYNKYAKENRAHGTILSALPVQTLIWDTVLQKSGKTPLYMNTQETSTTYPRFEIRAYSPVDIHLYQGEMHTGVLGEGETDLGRPFEMQVPNSHYEEWVDVKYAGAGLESGAVDVVLDGTGVGHFSLEIDLFEGGSVSASKFAWQDIAVSTTSKGTLVLESGEEPILAYDYDGDGTVDASLRSGETFEPAKGYPVSFAGLRTAIRDAKAVAFVERWLLAKVNLAEGLYAKNKKGTRVASQVALQVVAYQARTIYKKALGAHAGVIADLALKLAESL
jgi:hypothetical protein